MANPFEKFKTKTSKVKIKALGAEVEIREPTVDEVSKFFKILSDENGNIVNANFLQAKIQRVVDCMVEPKMTFDEVKGLSASASEALGEIYDAIDALLEKPKGN